MNFGQKIYTLRSERRMSQIDLGKILGVSQASVTGWETGRVSPNVETVMKLADYFHVSTDFLLYDTVTVEDDYSKKIVKAITSNSQLKELFDLMNLFESEDIDVILTVAKALSKKSN